MINTYLPHSFIHGETNFQASDVQPDEHAAAGADHVWHPADRDLGADGGGAQHPHPQLLPPRDPGPRHQVSHQSEMKSQS